MAKVKHDGGFRRRRSVPPISPVFFLLMFFLLYPIPVHSTSFADSSADFRVGISFVGNHLELSFGSEYCLFNMDSGEPLPLAAGRYKLTNKDGGIEFYDLREGDREFFQGPLYLQPATSSFADHSFRLHNALYGQEYRGALEIIPEGGDLMAVNVLDLESYLYGVLPAEMPPVWGSDGGMEALKAQAVAARTFALYHREARRHSKYHLCDQQHCQVYKGKGVETRYTDQAVNETCGEILTYEGRIIESFYHASNGGFTELSQNVWQMPRPYLASTPDPYDDPDNPLGLPGFKRYPPWVVEMPQQFLSDQLARKGYNIGEIERVNIASSFSSGRVEEVILQGKSGRAVSLSKEKAWTVLGLGSQLYTMRRELEAQLWLVSAKHGLEKRESIPELAGKWVINGHNDPMKSVLRGNKFSVWGDGVKDYIPYASLVFEGRGRGHGIGMSQYGAYNRSRAGQNYQEILSFYYPGTEVVIR